MPGTFAVIEFGQTSSTSVASAAWIAVAVLWPIGAFWAAHRARHRDPDPWPRGLMVVASIAYGLSSVADEITEGTAGLFWETSTAVSAALAIIATGWCWTRLVDS